MRYWPVSYTHLDVYKRQMCILEEMQWKRTRYITSADFFHGTLELVEPGVPVFLFMGCLLYTSRCV